MEGTPVRNAQEAQRVIQDLIRAQGNDQKYPYENLYSLEYPAYLEYEFYTDCWKFDFYITPVRDKIEQLEYQIKELMEFK